MPRDKDLKRLVRSRMRKTGESYTAARAQLVKKRAAVPESRPLPSPDEYAAIAGMSDAAVKAKTGCTWARWVSSLDHHGAERMTHKEIAALVGETWNVGPWWRQTVAVGYERIKGFRERGQQRDGTHQATRSRTYPVAVGELFDAWADAKVRRRWLGESGIRVRSSTKPKYLRLAWHDGAAVSLVFLPKGEGKSSVSVEQTKLPSREDAERVKKYWGEKLDELANWLER